MAKLTDKQRKKIIAEHIEGASIRALASKYKVSTTTIQRTIHGDTDFAQKVTEKKEANAKQVLGGKVPLSKSRLSAVTPRVYSAPQHSTGWVNVNTVHSTPKRKNSPQTPQRPQQIKEDSSCRKAFKSTPQKSAFLSTTTRTA